MNGRSGRARGGGSVRAQSELSQGSDRGAGKGKDAQGRGTGGSGHG